MIDWFEEGLLLRRVDPLQPVDRFNPDTAHRRIDFTAAVGAHAAARPIAHLFGAVGRASHAGGGERALAAHLAIEQQLLGRAFEWKQQPFRILEAGPLQRTAQVRGQARTGVIGPLENGRVPYAPMSQRLHAIILDARQLPAALRRGGGTFQPKFPRRMEPRQTPSYLGLYSLPCAAGLRAGRWNPISLRISCPSGWHRTLRPSATSADIHRARVGISKKALHVALMRTEKNRHAVVRTRNNQSMAARVHANKTVAAKPVADDDVARFRNDVNFCL